MSVQATREELMQKKEQLLRNLEEVQESLNKFDEIIYSGKLKKAIELLKEVLDYLTYPTITVECEDCGIDFELEFEAVIDELEKIYRTEFRRYD